MFLSSTALISGNGIGFSKAPIVYKNKNELKSR